MAKSFRSLYKDAKLMVIIVALLILVPFILFTTFIKGSDGVDVERSSEMGIACNGSKVKNAKQYKQDDTPHDTIVMMEADAKSREGKKQFNKYSLLASKDQALINATGATPKGAQLVACLERTGEEKTDQVCELDRAGKVSAYKTTWTMTVYEAKTHKEIKKTSVQTQDKFECGFLVTYDKNDPKLFYQPRIESVASELKSVIN